MQILYLQDKFDRFSDLPPSTEENPMMYRLSDAFPYLLNRVGVRMGELFSRRLEPYGVTLPMYRVMATLWEKGNQRLGELSEVTSIELSTLSASSER